ncbi:MAG: hypothetical protein AAF191_18350, partial [Verrucomicrobiota bacterium]
MVKWILKKIVGNQNQRRLRNLWPIAKEINQLEETLQGESDDHLRDLTAKWKAHLARYEDEVEYFAEWKLKLLTKEVQAEILSAWHSRFSALEDDFSQAEGAAQSVRSASASGDLEEGAKAVIEAQETYDQMRERFPKLRADYLADILPEAYAVVKNTARRLSGNEITVSDQPITWEMVH